MNSHIWRLNNLTMEYLTNDIANLPPDEPTHGDAEGRGRQPIAPSWSENLPDAFLYFPLDAARVADLLRSRFGIRHPHVETRCDAPQAAVPPDLFTPQPPPPKPFADERRSRHQEMLRRNHLD